jgi:curli production assembly/transport component CsgG
VLKTVHTTKTILSQRLESGIFRFVEVRRLLEAEVGFSFNEPPVLAVTEAIEEAVRGLIVEGVRDGLWQLRNAGDASSAAFQAYDEDVAAAERMGPFGQPVDADRWVRRGLGVGALAGGTLYEGDYANPLARGAAEVALRVPFSDRVAVELAGSASEIAAENAFSSSQVAGDARLLYHVFPRKRLSPYLTAGAGLLFQSNVEEVLPGDDGLYPYVTAGLGAEYLLSRRLGLNVALTNVYPLEEGLDGLVSGDVHDNFYTFKTGFVFYLR